MSKILINTTLFPVSITDVGITVAASSSYIIPPQDYSFWAASSNIITEIGNGTIIVNDGLIDLTIDEAIAFLSLSETAKGIRFDPSGSSLTAKNLEDAVKQVTTVSGGDSFFWRNIPSGLTVVVPENKQMLVYQELEISSSGELDNLGELVVIE
jgi:hypothetical protein